MKWQYFIKGKARMTVFNTGPNAMTMDFNAGDIGYVKKTLGHYMENVGDADLQLSMSSGLLIMKRFPCPTG
jgi:oxalate decarboxylase